MNDIKKEAKTELYEFFKLPEEAQRRGTTLPFIGFMNLAHILKETFAFDEFEGTGDETNGWQVDFWYYFKHADRGRYCLSGSLGYGEFEFNLVDDEDE